jgi:hypothetical protein
LAHLQKHGCLQICRQRLRSGAAFQKPCHVVTLVS